jgi:hypothetical protein
MRSPTDRADGLPLPGALDEESLIVAVISLPRSRAYGGGAGLASAYLHGCALGGLSHP